MTEPPREWLFEQMSEFCERTAQVTATCVRRFAIGGRSIEFHFVGEMPAPLLTRAFAHLEDAGTAPPDLTVSLFDGASAGIAPPLLLKAYLSAVAYQWQEFLDSRGTLLHFHAEPRLAVYHPGADVLSLLDSEKRSALYFRRTGSSLPYYEVASPLRTMLHGWFRSLGMQFVHAAALGTAGGGVLLAGKGGSGKSTSALACLGSGLQYAGDDYCLVELGAAPRVHSLYNTCKLIGDGDLQRFPGLAERVWNTRRTGDDKATIFLREHWPEQVSAGFPLRAILILRVTGERATRLRPARGMDALAAIGPSTIAQLPASDASDLRRLKEFAGSLPAWFLEVGTDLPQIPATIQELLARMTK